MYTVALMVAMTAGGDAPDGHCGYSYCSPCYTPCYTYCSPCYTPCYTYCSPCYTPCYTYCSPCYTYCTPCYTPCYTYCAPCYTWPRPCGIIVAPPSGGMGEKKEKEEKKEKKIETETNAPATLVVQVPADAKLTVGSAITTSEGTKRVFVSPTLEPKRLYKYTVTAEYTKDGKTVSVTKDAIVSAGNETTVSFEEAPQTNVVSR
jgi:uncharacterized protein (TIGR03000 family)